MILNSIRELYRLKRNLDLSPEKLREHQEERLKMVVGHAYENVPYYYRLFKNRRITPADIKSLEDIKKIPITTKDTLKNTPQEDLVARKTNLKNCVIKYTSGSTGNPLKMILSPHERDFHILLNLRILMENGLKITDKLTYIINPYRFPRSKIWFQNLGILRREYLSVFDYPQKHVEMLKDIKPDIIYGYPSNLALLALYIKENNIKGIYPKALFSIAEALEPTAKVLIDTNMKVNTCDILGTIELGDIAWQCEERNGYHISADAVIMEFLKEGDIDAMPGEEGRTVCTGLYNFTMPLIRYAVNDICVPSSRLCPCGRTLPMMESIKGRANDFIILPDGQIVASCFLVIIMQSFHSIKQYRVIQEDRENLSVQIVRGEGFTRDLPARIKDEMEAVTKKRLNVIIKIVDEIERDRSGKIRTVVSRVIPDLQKKIDLQKSLWVN